MRIGKERCWKTVTFARVGEAHLLLHRAVRADSQNRRAGDVAKDSFSDRRFFSPGESCYTHSNISRETHKRGATKNVDNFPPRRGGCSVQCTGVERCNGMCPSCCASRKRARAYCRLCKAHKYLGYLEREGEGWRCRSIAKCSTRGANYRK